MPGVGKHITYRQNWNSYDMKNAVDEVIVYKKPICEAYEKFSVP